ncbi:MAG: c-type cytochrome domain-containing protein, partial [Verrucomicrobiota bacterium]
MAAAPSSFRWLTRRCLILAAGLVALASPAQENEKLTYDDHIRPLLENKCFSCHNPDKKKGGLELTSYAGLMNGGSGGAVVDAGNPQGSRLWTCSAKKEEPFMPPEGAPLDAKDLTLLSKWIAGGLLQAKGSVAKASNKPKVDLTFAGGAGKPTGPVARPENVLLEPVIVTPRTSAVIAMAASPWTSLLAVAGQKQILLYDTDSHELAGILPYSEGYARSLKFSANGSLLVMGGGRGGKFGHAVVWDVKTGKRVTEVGKEFDQLMSADITPDHRKIAFGTNSKKVKCYDVATGEELYVIAKHTEWITGTDFSPDGVLLATSDRNGNVFVWEADNGGEFYPLGQHKGSVTDLAWRADSNILASCAADGTITTWEMKTGKQVASWSAHGGNVQSVSFLPDGRLLSCGADGTTAMWAIDGKRLQHLQGIKQADQVAKVVGLYDSKAFVSSNWLGEIRFFESETGREVTQVSSN